jgi:hypothetical protein
VKRLLQFALLCVAFALYGIGVNIISGIASPTAAPQLASQPMPPEPTTTTTLVEPETTITAPSTTVTPKPVIKPKIITATSIVRQSTTTTEAPKTPLEIAQSQVGKTGPYAEGGYWCAKFVSWVAEQAKVEGFQSSDSPARLHTIAKEQGRLTDVPLPGYLVFIDLEGGNDVNDYITHVGIVETVDGTTVHTVEGNADHSGRVTRQVHELGDGYVIDFTAWVARR